MLGTLCAPLGPYVTASESFALPESPCTLPIWDPLVHPNGLGYQHGFMV